MITYGCSIDHIRLQVRSRSVEYAQLLLTHIAAVPEGERCPLERYADALTTALKAALADALADARAGARSCLPQP